MALITMVVHCTKENNRYDYFRKAFESLFRTVDRKRHEIYLVLNGCDVEELNSYVNNEHLRKHVRYEVIVSKENLGTARAINLSWKNRKPGQHAIKIDDDIVIEQSGWADRMEETAERMKHLHIDGVQQIPGVIGLKRKDCGESMYREDWGRGQLFEVPHEPGQRWIVVEYAHHIMGSCCMYTADLLDKIGYMYQGDLLYGYDDTLMCSRSRAVKMQNMFLHGFDIDHIDPGDTEVAKRKRDSAGGLSADWCMMQQKRYESGEISPYHGPDE